MGRLAVDLDALDEQTEEFPDDFLDPAPETGDEAEGRATGQIIPKIHGSPPHCCSTEVSTCLQERDVPVLRELQAESKGLCRRRNCDGTSAPGAGRRGWSNILSVSRTWLAHPVVTASVTI